MPTRLFMVLLFTIAFPKGVLTQHSHEIQRLMELAGSQRNDSAKVAALNQLGFEGDDYGLDGETFAKEGLHLSTILNIQSEKAKALLNQSLHFTETGAYDSALMAIEEAQSLYGSKDSTSHASFYAKYYFALGMLALPQGNDKDGALKNFLNALRFAQRTKDNYLVSVCYGGISTSYNFLRQFDKGIESNHEYLNFALQSKDTLALAKAYQNLSSAYLNAGNQEQYSFYAESYENLVPHLKNPFYNWLLVHNRALSYAEKGLFEQAVIEAEQSIEIAKKEQLPTSKLLASYYLTGYCHYLLKQYETSNGYMMEVAKLADSIHSPEYKMYAASGLAENYALLKAYEKAYENLSLQLTLSDSLSSEKTKINSNYLHIKNKIEQKESQIREQQSSIKLNRTLNYILIGSLACLLAMGFLVYRNYSYRKKIQLQRIQELESEKQLLEAQALLKGQEEERSRIAKDLHDGLGGLLSGVKLQLGAMKGNLILTEENGKVFNRALDKLDESIAEMRRVAHNMMPESLLKFGLYQALTDYAEGLSVGQDFVIDLEVFGLEKRLPSSSEIVIYRIVQELINNAVKHARASKILVQLIRHQNQLNITVEDNGIGFNKEENSDKKTAGLQNIRSRVNYLNGKLDFQSRPGHGTSVFIELELESNG
ncbi:sensor histidine kinase [Flagellimonas amoyensis]|uniref:tetratricopeptide repeat-containing sensor histidine kinase n=1 Tax=Flagellimonas amoyensis TaxID=2169401 RepID=UPI000D3DB0C7|nr:sensor histidine kinase [Allomuricauda amoyensis]